MSKKIEKQSNKTRYTKIFIGGLAWATERESIKRYFERFGPIVEAAVIFDKLTGRSKGYGFVTFKHPDSALKACENPYPLIDGRRTNCNLAAFGALNHPPSTSPLYGSSENLRSDYSLPVSTYFCENNNNNNNPEFYTFPYSSGYRYHGSSPQDMFVMNNEGYYYYYYYYVPLQMLQ